MEKPRNVFFRGFDFQETRTNQINKKYTLLWVLAFEKADSDVRIFFLKTVGLLRKLVW